MTKNNENPIKPGDWVRMKSNPEVIIKVPLATNPNKIVDFREQRTEPPFHAYPSDLEVITDEDIIAELEVNFAFNQIQKSSNDFE